MSDKEVRIVNATGGEKGSKEARMGLLPPEALKELSRIYAKGAEKYSDFNWRKGYDWHLSYDALLRHANAFWSGEDFDPEFGDTYHILHAAWHCFTLFTFITDHPELDDRWSTVKAKQESKKPAIQVELEQKLAEAEARIWELENPNTHPVEELRRDGGDLGDPWGINRIFDFEDDDGAEMTNEVVYDRPDQRKEKIVKYGVPDRKIVGQTAFGPIFEDPEHPWGEAEPGINQTEQDRCCHNCRFGCLLEKDSE